MVAMGHPVFWKTTLNASFELALDAARAAAGMQHYPEATLYVVATPIGNLADITLRALHAMQLADAIACEDTRHTQPLLRHYGIDKPLLAVHEHNEAQAAGLVIERLQRGERVAYVSDAGTPAVSDPGARLVAAAQAAGYRVMPLPGASSVTTALSVAGLAGDGAFVFAGFLPSKAGERDQAIALLGLDARATVILEAPHRIEALARAMAPLGGRLVTVGRELTKQFEEIATVPAQELAAWLAAGPQRTRGEFALVLHPAIEKEAPQDNTCVLQLLLAELPLKTAVKLAAEITGAPRNELYEAALQLKNA
jgi:16S rRNA (cytidine1402-2'-O)-methyltransferase